MIHQNGQPGPEALLLLGTHCPHCPSVLHSLAELVKQGEISRLEIVNMDQRPDIAARWKVRSVPWVRLGPFELSGLHSPGEYREWARKAGRPEGLADYLTEIINTGNVQQAVRLVAEHSAFMDAVMLILGDQDARINVRLGIGVIIEELQGNALLKEYAGRLGALSTHAAASVRADACHYLALTGALEVSHFLEARLDDPDAAVREIAADSLEVISGLLTHP